MGRRKKLPPADPTPLLEWMEADPGFNTLTRLSRDIEYDHGVVIPVSRLSQYKNGLEMPGPRNRWLMHDSTGGDVSEKAWYVYGEDPHQSEEGDEGQGAG